MKVWTGFMWIGARFCGGLLTQSDSTKSGQLLDQLSYCHLLKKDFVTWELVFENV
jgi:hypothetical protein